MDYTKPTRNHESFKNHFLQFINCNNIYECHDLAHQVIMSAIYFEYIKSNIYEFRMYTKHKR